MDLDQNLKIKQMSPFAETISFMMMIRQRRNKMRSIFIGFKISLKVSLLYIRL